MQNNIIQAFVKLEQLLTTNGYSADDMIITSCPSAEQVSILLSSASILAAEGVASFAAAARKISTSSSVEGAATARKLSTISNKAEQAQAAVMEEPEVEPAEKDAEQNIVSEQPANVSVEQVANEEQVTVTSTD